jgi:hypothetical protein
MNDDKYVWQDDHIVWDDEAGKTPAVEDEGDQPEEN